MAEWRAIEGKSHICVYIFLQDELLDETGDFADFRCSVIEVMRDIVFIVGSVNCFRKVRDGLNRIVVY